MSAISNTFWVKYLIQGHENTLLWVIQNFFQTLDKIMKVAYIIPLLLNDTCVMEIFSCYFPAYGPWPCKLDWY